MKDRRPFAFACVSNLNAWLVLLASLFRPVLAAKNWNKAVKGPGSWVPSWCRNHEIARGFSYNELRDFDEVGWRFYRRHLRGGKLPPVGYNSSGLEVDYGPLLLKAICEELPLMVSLRRAARRLGLPKPIYLGTMAWTSSIGHAPPGWVPALHRLTVWAAEAGRACVIFALEAWRLARALLSPRISLPKTDVLWIGINTNEYGEFGNRRCFYWPDRVSGSSLRNVYVIPRNPSPHFRDILRRENILWLTKFDLLRVCRKPELIGLVCRLAGALGVMLLPWRGSWVLRARLAGYHFEGLVWTAFARATGASAAITAGSSWTSQMGDISALRAAGLRTGLWFYSANSIPFGHPGGKPRYNGKLRTVHEAERIYVWSPHIARWNHENLCRHPRNQVVVCGPLMCGDAAKCLASTPAGEPVLRLAVFDVTKPAGMLADLLVALHLPAEFFGPFWSDIHRLAREFSNLRLVLKPKRSAKNALRSVEPAFQNLIGDARLQGRIEILEDDADPYEAIARSDAALCMPFTSPALAAWHFGKAGLFYDPTGVVAVHRFQDFGRYFPRSYAELSAVVTELIAGRAAEFPGNLSEFIGRRRLENPQCALLEDLAEWIGRAPRENRGRAAADEGIALEEAMAS